MGVAMPAQLRIYTGSSSYERSDHERSDHWTLSTVFRDKIRPMLVERRRAEATIEDYARAVRTWEEITGDPSLDSISEMNLDLFAASLAERHLSARTITKYLGYLQSILDLCGPSRGRDRRSPLGRPLGLLEQIPAFQFPDSEEPALKRTPSRDDVAAILEKCYVARVPIKHPGLKWSAAVRILDWCGVRRTDLFHLRRKNWLDSSECPVPSARGLSWPHGWLSFVPEKTKRVRKRPLVIPLSPEIASLLRAIPRADSPEVPLLGFAPHGTVQWYREFGRIQLAAGISEPFGFHEMRKGCNVAWNLIFGGAGERFLGHAAKGVNQKHYGEEVAAMVAAAKRRLGME